MHIIFETPRLFLRRFTPDDAGLILSMNSDPAVLQYLHEPLLLNEQEAGEVIRDIILPQYKRDLGRWAVHRKDDQEFIGWCGLKYRPELEEIDLGYRFIRSAWGYGYATEAAAHTLSYGFNHLHIPLITGRAHVDNLASIRVLEKIGMKFLGLGTVDKCLVRTYIAKIPAKPL